MATNYLETGDTGRAISAESDGALLAGIFGNAKYVLENGSQFNAEVQSNNIVKISDGDAVMCGRHVRIPANDSALVTINNGHSGTNRIDLIVFRYTKDSTGKEATELAVIQGEDSTGVAIAPTAIEGDILTGAMQADFPLYSVELNGINIVNVTALFELVGNISRIAQTNKDLSKLLDYDPTEKTYSENGWTMKYRHISHNQVYVTLQNTNTGATEAIPNNLIMAGVPLQILFAQCIPVKMVVGSTIVGYGSIMFSGKGAYLQSVAYGNSVSWVGYGVVTVE